MNLPYDYARCVAKAAPCPDKERCARFISPGRPNGWQSMIDASEMRMQDKCAMFIDATNREAVDDGVVR